jgi:hypothetical protein
MRDPDGTNELLGSPVRIDPPRLLVGREPDWFAEVVGAVHRRARRVVDESDRDVLQRVDHDGARVIAGAR